MTDSPLEYRVNFIRGRAQNILDSMLPLFAQAVDETCPIPEKMLTGNLEVPLAKYFPQAKEKTLQNYVTEIIGKLFGMVVHNSDGSCTTSDLTLKLMEDADQPAFFKVLASRIQFPNPMNRLRSDYEANVREGVGVRPLVLVLETLRDLKGPATYLELRTFVLANLRAYRAEFTSKELAAQIIASRIANLRLPNPDTPNRPYHHQHVKELLGFLELANLVRETSTDVYELNTSEFSTLEWIFKSPSSTNLFRPLEESEDYRTFQKDWSHWYGSLPQGTDLHDFDTTLEALQIPIDVVEPTLRPGVRVNTQEIGRVGEQIVLAWQSDLVGLLRPQDAKHVKDRSAERGIGFDIQSVWSEGALEGQFRYIEVKTTKRSTKPTISRTQPDMVTLTANEYRAAKTHAENFTISRVYLFSGGFEVYCIDDPVAKGIAGDVILEPADWSLFLTEKAIVEPSHRG